MRGDAIVMDRTPVILYSLPAERAESDCACPVGEALPPVLSALRSGNRFSDCACPASLPLPDVVMPVAEAAWRSPTDLYRAPLSSDYEVVFRPAGPAGVVVLGTVARQVLDSFASPRPLDPPSSPPRLPRAAHSIARQLATLGLLVPTHATGHGTCTVHRALTVWLHLTTRCNLHCAYCYAPRGGKDMHPDVGRAAIDATFRSALAYGLTVVKIKYAGGEPALNFSTVRTVHTYARQQAAQTGVDLHEVLLSNGVALTGSMMEWLRAEGIRLAISLDGIGPEHDQQRPATRGESTFDAVVAAIDRAQATGLSPHLSITVTARNVDNLPEVVAFALDRGLTFHLNFVRPAPGTPDLIPPTERLIASLQSVAKTLERHPPAERIIDSVLDRCDLGGPHRYPCGAGRSYLVIDPEGRVARCHMEMQAGVGTVWDENPLKAVRTADVGVRNPPVDSKDGCRDCLWRYVCAGGCPLLARRLVGREDVRSPYCQVYRAILPALVRAEGVRLLKERAERDRVA